MNIKKYPLSCFQILSLGANPNIQDRKGRSPAHCAASKGQFEALKILHSNNGDLWLSNVRGDLPIHDAVHSGRKDLVSFQFLFYFIFIFHFYYEMSKIQFDLRKYCTIDYAYYTLLFVN